MSADVNDAARRVVAHLAAASPDDLLTVTESDWPEAYIAVDEPFVAALLPGHTPLPPLHPVTLIESRYGGAYEPGPWLAFPCPPDDLPNGWDEQDVPCMRFWKANPGAAGGGRTPAEAYAALMADVLPAHPE
ncbi:hypothetical protein ADK57_27330 [Streptomyces sp. MMG1533]|uniref:hypothetical protein n=1 Tax=Streptomyces sp. MMG1533 TaxID=1415546 RepID=UPI0006B06052|nr:hypothetical protein [Streptomyces sp. MMG1533]KOU61624.1 hypothetical protein ADK57_27330 [Streptomyces sp. MMG1533]